MACETWRDRSWSLRHNQLGIALAVGAAELISGKPRGGWEGNLRRIAAVLALFFMSAQALAFNEADRQRLAFANECSSCDLSGLDLSNGSFHGGDFSLSNLAGANLADAVLATANLQESNLRGTNFSGAELDRASFSGADLTGANLSNTDISGADFSGVKGLTQAQLDQTCDDGSADPAFIRLPEGLTVKRCF